MRYAVRFFSLLLIVFAHSGFSARAQTPGVSVNLAGKRIGIGEQAILLIKVANAQAEGFPQTVAADGLKINLLPDTNITRKFVNGVMTSEIDYYYQIIGEREGTLTVPPIPFSLNGRATVTDAQTIEVFKRKPGDLAFDASKPYFVRLECPHPEIYEGQSVPITLTVYSRSNIQQITPPDVQVSDNGQVHAFALEVDQKTLDIDGYNFITAAISSQLTALRPGEMTLGPANIVATILESSDPFGFGSRNLFTQTVARKMASNSLSIMVKPLPTEGRPASFRLGSVGNFELSLEASPKELQAGDPLEIELTLTGEGSLESIEAPVFQAPNPEDWRVFEPKKTVEAGKNGAPGRAVFSQVIIPKKPVTELPPFEFAFFDPKTATYGVRRSQPVPLRITQDSALVQTGAGGGEGALPSAASSARLSPLAKPQAEFSDILHISTLPLSLKPPPEPLLANDRFWLAQIPPALLFFGLVGWGTWRALRDNVSRRPRAAAPESYRTLRHRLDQPEVRGQRTTFLQAALACVDHLRHQPGSPENAQALAKLASRVQQILYGPESKATPNEPLPAPDVLDITRELDQLSASRPR